MKPAVYGAIVLGMLLLMLSGFWPRLFPGTSAWTPEKSAEWTKVKNRLHTLGFTVGSHAAPASMHSGTETGQAKQEYDQLKVQHEALTAEFTTAHDRPYTIAKILRWSGISLAILGIIGVYASNQSR